MVELPFLFSEEFGFTELRQLAARLATVPATGARRAGRS
jgi:hypothetical protein